MFANGAVFGANSRNNMWKTEYTLISINSYSLKLTDSVYLIILKAFNFLKFNFSYGHLIFKNFCDR